MLIQLSSALYKHATAKTFGLLLLAYGIYMPVFFYANVPFGLTQIAPYAANGGILDLDFFYSAAQAYQRLAGFGPDGRATYLRILMGDLIYPGLLGVFISVTLSLLLRRIVPAGGAWRYVNLLPIANMAADYLENAMLIALLAAYPAQLNGIAAIAGVATAIKSVFGLLSFVALGVVLLIWVIQRVMRRPTT